jgi:hypothetical protein
MTLGESQTSGAINIGAGSTRTGTINIGTGSTGANLINIGSGTSDIKLNGIVNVEPVTNNGGTTGVLYGKTGYDTVTNNYTIPATINNNYFLRISAGAPTIALPVPVQHQIITIRSISASNTTVNATVGVTIFLIGSSLGTASTTITGPGCLKLYAISTTNWYEI